MKKFFLLLIIFVLNFNHCYTLNNRINDVRDIFTLGLEKKVYGSSLFFWCIGGGIQHASEGMGFGIRRGYVGEYYTGGEKVPDFYNLQQRKYTGGPEILITKHTHKYGDSYLIDNSHSFNIIEKKPSLRYKQKEFKISNFVIFSVEIQDKVVRENSGTSYSSYYINRKREFTNCNAPLTTEFSFGIHYGFRIGFNFSEAFDLLVGFVGFDPMDDDYDENGNLPNSPDKYLRVKPVEENNEKDIK